MLNSVEHLFEIYSEDTNNLTMYHDDILDDIMYFQDIFSLKIED